MSCGGHDKLTKTTPAADPTGLKGRDHKGQVVVDLVQCVVWFNVGYVLAFVDAYICWFSMVRTSSLNLPLFDEEICG